MDGCGVSSDLIINDFIQFSMSGFYDQLCNMLIRPARQTYSDYDLGRYLPYVGPPTLGSLALRTNFTFQSPQKHQIKASFYKQKNPVSDACVLYLHSFNGSRLERILSSI